MRFNYIVGLIIITLLFASSCTKEEFKLDENTVVPGLTPSLAIPLAHADIGLAELEGPLGLDDELYNLPGSPLAIVFKERLFEIGLEDLIALPPQEVSQVYAVDALTAAFFNASLAGTELPISQIYNLPFDFENGEDIDSIRLGESFLSIDMTSSFRHDLDIQLEIPELVGPDGPFTTEFSLDYQGSLPVLADVVLDVSGYLLDFSASGNSNEININADFILTHSGELTNAGDSVQFNLDLSSNSIKAGYGYLGQYAGIAEIDTQRVNIFETIDAESIYFADPAIELDFYNSSGIPMEINFSSIYAPGNSTTQEITGGALEDIPIIAAAAMPGLEALTEHRIDNSNTSPPLSDLLSEGPVDLIYTADGVTNPEGYTYNFILDTSKVACDATVILPLYASVNGYRFADTLDVDLNLDLGFTEGGTFSIDDVELAQFRIVSDNALPIDLAMQVVFLDEDYLVTDSLFIGEANALILSAGIIDPSLPESHPDYGRVIFPAHHVQDVSMSPERLEELLNGNVKHVILRVLGNTSEAEDGAIVKFYPEDEVEIQFSAKIETDIDLTE